MFRNSKILFIILFSLFFTSIDIYAQQAKCNITGTVVDQSQEPITYASVAIYSEKPIAGVVTDNDGSFSLNIPQNSTSVRLTIDFIGYKKFETDITPNCPKINIDVFSPLSPPHVMALSDAGLLNFMALRIKNAEESNSA